MPQSIESEQTDLTLKEQVMIEQLSFLENNEEEYGKHLAWSQIRRAAQMGFSEFLGTFILILFGLGSIAQVVLSSDQKGTFISTNWGMALVLLEPDEQR